jgi:uncharacterized membrane protein
LDNVHSISSRVRLDHVISFSDAIFAFSITFMALSIQIPKLSSNLTQVELINKILHLRPQFEIYAISFLIIGVYWISYHLIFNYIRASHSVLIWANLAFLFFITLISFATSLETVYPLYHIVFLLYAAIITITGLLLAVIWLHASKDRLLVDKNMSPIHIRAVSLQVIIPPLIFATSIAISFVDIQIAQYFWILIVPAKMIIQRTYRY